jgi:hypothetical protein
MISLDPIIESVRTECYDDFVGLWSVARLVRSSLPEPSQTRQVTLAIIGKLLTDGDIAAGQFEGRDFVKWTAPLEAIISTIGKEWTKLSRDPDIGEIVWLTARKRVKEQCE